MIASFTWEAPSHKVVKSGQRNLLPRKEHMTRQPVAYHVQLLLRADVFLVHHLAIEERIHKLCYRLASPFPRPRPKRTLGGTNFRAENDSVILSISELFLLEVLVGTSAGIEMLSCFAVSRSSWTTSIVALTSSDTESLVAADGLLLAPKLGLNIEFRLSRPSLTMKKS